MPVSARNTDRLDLRVAHETRARWERAAEIAGASSVASFVKMVVTERADALIREHDTLTLTGEESAWLHAFHDQEAQGPIVAGRLHIFVWGRKPE